jgi:hypothetical protein
MLLLVTLWAMWASWAFESLAFMVPQMERERRTRMRDKLSCMLQKQQRQKKQPKANYDICSSQWRFQLNEQTWNLHTVLATPAAWYQTLAIPIRDKKQACRWKRKLNESNLNQVLSTNFSISNQDLSEHRHNNSWFSIEASHKGPPTLGSGSYLSMTTKDWMEIKTDGET